MNSSTLAVSTLVVILTYQTNPQKAPSGAAPERAHPATATSPDEAMERLDQPIPLFTLEASPLPDAIQKLSHLTGVPIRFKKDAMTQLPWGAKTKLSSLKIENATLRETLSKILTPLGLRYKPEGDGVTIMMQPALDRIDGRATWKDLALLQQMTSTPYTPEAFESVKIQYRITGNSNADAPALLAARLERAGKGTIAEMLENATAALGWTWVPEDDHVVIITCNTAIARNLATRVTNTYTDQNLGRILFDLGREADVHIFLQPGTFKALPENIVEHYSLRFENISVRQAIEYICADTGLAYRTDADGVHVGPAADIKRLPVTTPEEDPYVAKLSFPVAGKGFSYEFLIRESEMPPDIQTIRRKAIKEMMQEIRRTAPSSQPSASRPAASRSTTSQPAKAEPARTG